MNSLQTTLKANALLLILNKLGMNPQIQYINNKAIIKLTKQDAILLINKLEQEKKESDIEFDTTEFIIEILIRKFLKIIVLLILIGFVMGKLV